MSSTSHDNVIADLTRELEKAYEVLKRIDLMMEAEATMNAAKHMSDRVIPNPLASLVASSLTGVEFGLKRGKAAMQGELPLDFKFDTSAMEPATFGGE